MKAIFCIAALVGASSVGLAQEMSLQELTDYEKSLHRWAWCDQVNASTEICEYGCNDILSISRLLRENGRRSSVNDPRDVYARASQDTEADLLLGRVIVDEGVLAKCEADLLQILSSEYVPNFEYITQEGK